jgi:orotate phosphoribosyltransferase
MKVLEADRSNRPHPDHPGDHRLQELGRDIVSAAYLRGDFVLSSGARSSYYFDKYLFETRPSILRRVASALADLVPSDADRIAGPELGGVALATALSLMIGLPFVIVKKVAKGYGTSHAIEGELHSGDKVIVVEDVITTGAQAIHAARQLERSAAHVLAILAVIDREQGGTENITSAGYRFQPLFRRRDLGL